MPLNKLENFIKNYEGRILYVNSNDLDATDSITNQGNSLAKPFKTIQRAVLESARFSFIPGENNDRNDRTTILVFPGEHLIDNRPGWGIRKAGVALAEAISPSGVVRSPSSDVFNLNLQTNFDLTQEDNILYKFNSVNGGIVLPRGTSIIGLDLRKTKIRPKYVPNPTDENVPRSAMFRVTGNCFFWNFSFFDANSTETVYTDNKVFNVNSGNQAIPTFSHHKLTCFEYCDGVNIPAGYDLTDLDMYYAKLSNAFNEGSGREVPSAQKFPLLPEGFAKERSEWEIVGAFGTDPVQITDIYSGDRATPNAVVTVTTSTPHNLTVDTPIKIRGVNVFDYNISTVVQSVPTPTTFTYLLQSVRNDLPADPGGAANVVIDTDTVRGASPYIFNCSLRSVWGLNGMHTDGSKASGFRSMVVAQFTAISLQKDDRAFVKYDPFSKTYLGIPITRSTGSKLSSESASTNSSTVYHLDADAVYRRGWETAHIKCSNDAIIQVVSVFAIGFNGHFVAESGGDQSITNSNSNFGQFSLLASGFKKEAFTKDNYGYITSIITPKAITASEQTTDWMTIDINLTSNVGISSHVYLFGFKTLDNPPPSVVSGAKIGARKNEKLYLTLPGVGQTVTSGTILMSDNVISPTSLWIDGFSSSEKEYKISVYATAPKYDTLYTSAIHRLQTGEKIIFVSDTGELPDNIKQGTVYYAIRGSGFQTTELRVATSLTNAVNGVGINVSGGANLKVISRVIDKDSGEIGSPIQYDPNNSNWFIHLDPTNTIYPNVVSLGTAGFDNEPRTEATYVSRIPDSRSLDERLYKVRIVIPKEAPNAKDPSEGFVIQESNKTGALETSEFTLSNIGLNNFDYKRNYRFINICSESNNVVTVRTEKPHKLNIGDRIFIKNVKSSSNTTGLDNKGYNGDFTVASVVNHKEFTYSTTDVYGIQHNVGVFTAPTGKTRDWPRIERNDLQSNFYIYRVETISQYIFNAQDGVYHAYVLKADLPVPNHFTDYKYSQNVVDLYPQQDRDNINDNPQSTYSFAKSSPLGDVVTNDLKKSLTREALDSLIKSFGEGLIVSSATDPVNGISNVTFAREHGLGGIVGYASLNPGSGFTNGTYYNVRLTNTDNTWNGATATVVVSGGTITSLQITDNGCGYVSGQTLRVEGFSPATITLSSAVITSAVNNVIQFSGIGTASDNLLRIQSVLSPTQIAVAKTAGDPRIETGQYAIQVGPSAITSSTQRSSVTGITTFTFEFGHGLIIGNKFKVVADSFSASNNLGDYIVREVVGVNTFTAITNRSFDNAVRILKYGINSNDVISNSANENIGSRGHHFYDKEYAVLSENISATDTSGTATFAISIPNSGISTTTRFDLGSYIMIDSEILRISSSTLSGSANNKITAIRGYFGTTKDTHGVGSLIRKIKPIPIELRRPSILRASGHTFEYLGYGPGNYSTGLPQIQVKTLSEREDFLAQSQEKSGGSALYTGMNSDGDFFIGNTKYSAQSGEETSFDIPVATVTGQDPTRLSALFDETIIRERIVVEGGKSKQILSQFDGPVNFSENVIFNSEQLKINALLVTSGLVKFNNLEQSTAINNGAVVVRGGVGILKNLNVGQDFRVYGKTVFEGAVTFNAGLIPETVESAYIGVSTLPWASAWIAGVGIATQGVPGGLEDQDRTITGLTGNLILNSSSGITSITDNLEVGQTLLIKGDTRLQGKLQVDTGIIPDSNEGAYLGTATTSFSEAHIAEINLGVGQTSKINTRSGRLFLDSAAGIVEINDAVEIQETLKVSGGTLFTGAAVFENNILPHTETTTSNPTIGTLTKKFSAAHIDEIQIGYTDSNTIDTASGQLTLGSANNQTTIKTRLTVDQTSIFTGIVTVTDGIVPSTSNGCGIGLSTRRFSEAHIDNVRIAYNDSSEIDTRVGPLYLDSAEGTVIVDDHLDVNQTLNVDGRTYLAGLTTVATGLVPHQDEGAYLGTASLPFSEAWIGEIAIATGANTDQNDRTIKTVSGRLFLDSFEGTVEIDDHLDVNQTLNVDGQVYLSGITSVRSGIFPHQDFGCAVGSESRRFSESYIGNLKLAVGNSGNNNNTVTTTSGILYLDSFDNMVITDANSTINNNLVVEGTSHFAGLTTVASGLFPFQDTVGSLGSADKRFGNAWIGKLKFSTDDYKDNGVTTTEGDLYLNSSNGTVDVEDNLIVRETLTVDSTSKFKGVATVDIGISPDTSKGAYVGTPSLPFSDAHIGNIQIAYGVNGISEDDDNLISTVSGNLKLNSSTGKVSIVNDLEINSNFRSVGFATFVSNVYFAEDISPTTNERCSLGTAERGWSSAYIDEIVIDENKITTTVTGAGSGQNLVLGASSEIVDVENNLLVRERLTINNTSLLKGIATLEIGISPDTSKGAYVGTPSLPFSDAHIGNVRIAYGSDGSANDDDNLISTSSSDLKLDSSAGKVSIVNDLEINRNFRSVGISTFTNNVHFGQDISPTTNELCSLGTAERNWSAAYIDEVLIDVNEVTTTLTGSGSGQNLKLNASSQLVTTDYDFSVGRNLTVTGTSAFTNKLSLGNNIHPTTTNGASLGESDKVFSVAYIDKLVLDGSTVTTTAGNNLVLSANTGAVVFDVHTQLGISTFIDNVTLRGLDKTFIVRNNSGIEKFKVESTEGNTVTQGTLECKTTTTTRNLTVTGQNNSTTHATIGSASVRTPSTSTTTGSLVVYGGLGVESGNVNVSGSVNVGTNLGVTGTSSFTGTATFTGLLRANGGIQGTISLANKATNVVGSSNCIPFNTGTDITTTSSNLQFVNTATPELRVAGDIIAFYGSSSDDRLKENRKKLNNALDKVLSLNGFTYTWNEKAISLGFDETQTCVGVSAQEVQKVLPEAVIERELNGESILLVKYEKIVPLLVEAIKELNEKVERLQSLLDK